MFFVLCAELDVDKVESELAAAAADEINDEDLVCPKTLENEDQEDDTTASDIHNSSTSSSLTSAFLRAQALDAPLVPESGKYICGVFHQVSIYSFWFVILLVLLPFLGNQGHMHS